MTDTQSLIARLEAATGPDRKLDAAIAAVAKAGLPAGCDWAFKFPNWEADHSRGGRVNVIGNVNGNGDYIAAHFTAPAYTASIDAALTLVPPAEEWPDGHTDFTLDFQSGQCVCDFTCWARDGEDISVESPLYVRAPTPALAIVIAALRAIEAGAARND